VWDPASGKKIRKTFDNLSEAKAWRHDASGAVRRGELKPSTRQTLAEYAEKWIDGIKSGTVLDRAGKTYKPSVIRGYERSLRKRVLPVLGHKRLADVTRHDVQALADRLRGDGLSPSTVTNTVMPLRAIYRRAIRDGLVSVNPTSNLDLPAANSRRIVHVSKEDVAEFLASQPDDIRPLYATAAYGGLRRGEIRGLRWSDVDLANSEIHVRRGWDDKDGEIDPKSLKSARTAPIYGILRDYLDEHKMRTGGSGDNLVFASKHGKPFTSTNIARKGKRAARAAGVRYYGLHDLRHFYVSFSVDMGLDLAQIGDYVGHSSAYMTDRYRHLLEDARQRARERADAYFADTGTFTGTSADEEALDPAAGAESA
jgi:integrase